MHAPFQGERRLQPLFSLYARQARYSSRTDHYDFHTSLFLVCYKGRAYMDSLKRRSVRLFLIICSELILNGSCGEEGSVFYRNPRPVLGIFIGRNAIAYCDSTLNGVLIRMGPQRNTRIGSLYGCKYGVREVPFESYGGKPTSVLLLYTTLIISVL